HHPHAADLAARGHHRAGASLPFQVVWRRLGSPTGHEVVELLPLVADVVGVQGFKSPGVRGEAVQQIEQRRHASTSLAASRRTSSGISTTASPAGGLNCPVASEAPCTNTRFSCTKTFGQLPFLQPATCM